MTDGDWSKMIKSDHFAFCCSAQYVQMVVHYVQICSAHYVWIFIHNVRVVLYNIWKIVSDIVCNKKHCWSTVISFFHVKFFAPIHPNLRIYTHFARGFEYSQNDHLKTCLEIISCKLSMDCYTFDVILWEGLGGFAGQGSPLFYTFFIVFVI